MIRLYFPNNIYNIKKGFWLMFVLVSLAINSWGQYKTVMYQYERNWFNENQPLPAESYWILNGELPNDVEMVELMIHGSANFTKKPLYNTEWRQAEGSSAKSFGVPVNYKLQGNDKYSFSINFYRPLSSEEKQKLLVLLDEGIEAYISQSVLAKNNNVKLRHHPKLMLTGLNQIVGDGLKLYRAINNTEFEGFSGLILGKIEQIDHLKLRQAKFNMLHKKEDDKREVRVKYFVKQLKELKVLCRKELVQYLNGNILELADSRRIRDYRTEKVKTVVPVNIGYAGVYNGESLKDGAYAGSPSVGISFPLGKPSLNNKFWSNSSISGGVFLNNLAFSEDLVATGPLINRPFYLGLGYKTLYFIRLNAGATFMQYKENGQTDLSINKTVVKPYVGVVMEINLWMGFER